jgi:hypothetical protein
MVNDPCPRDDLVQSRRFEQIADDEPEVRPIPQRRDMFLFAAAEVIKGDDAVAAGDERGTEFRADAAGAAGDEDVSGLHGNSIIRRTPQIAIATSQLFQRHHRETVNWHPPGSRPLGRPGCQ